MLELAIWIGIALCGVAFLGFVEYLRAKGILRINTAALKTVLPIAALMLLMGVAGAMAVLFFFLFFLSDYWEYALVFGGLLFAFLVVRIRGERSFFAPAPRGQVGGVNPDEREETGTGDSGLAMQVGAAVAIVVMMVPVLTGGFLIYMVLEFIAGKIGGWPILLPILAVISLVTYVVIRRRASSPP